MDRLNYIERLKDALHDTDYIAIKASEGCDVSYHGEWKAERQAIRDEINRIEGMTADEFYEAYPDEREVEIPSEDFVPGEEPYDIDIVVPNNENEEEN